MTVIRPFNGIRYNQALIKSLAEVICPPYDIISPQQQDDLYNRSEYNFIRIEFNKETEQDDSRDNRYTRANAYIKEWLEKEILKADSAPAMYLHRHSFTCLGVKYQRNNLLALVRLEEWNTGVVKPHENIIPKAKSDRMSMLKVCEANTSTVLSMYADPGKKIAAVLSSVQSKKPDIDFVDPSGERQEVWVIDQPELIEKLEDLMSSQPLYIADGHHRYDSALTCRRERIAAEGTANGDEGFNYVLMNMFDFEDPGLVILPTHRLLKGIPAKIMAGMKTALNAYFEVTELSMKPDSIWQKFDNQFKGIGDQIKLSVYGLEPGKLLVLTLRDPKSAGKIMPPGHSETYRRLDVSVVDHLILDTLVGFVKDSEEMTIAYDHDRYETIKRVDSGEFQLAFVLGPFNPDAIKRIADEGDRMPRKSTYFYPKAPAGLVFYKW